jgi:hypothetical protein
MCGVCVCVCVVCVREHVCVRDIQQTYAAVRVSLNLFRIGPMIQQHLMFIL